MAGEVWEFDPVASAHDGYDPLTIWCGAEKVAVVHDCGGPARNRAHLITAAPNLYEALERLVAYGDIFRYKQGEENPYEQAMAALAKARGEAS